MSKPIKSKHHLKLKENAKRRRMLRGFHSDIDFEKAKKENKNLLTWT